MLECNASVVTGAARYSEPHDAFFGESLVYAVDVRCAVALKRIEKLWALWLGRFHEGAMVQKGRLYRNAGVNKDRLERGLWAGRYIVGWYTGG